MASPSNTGDESLFRWCQKDLCLFSFFFCVFVLNWWFVSPSLSPKQQWYLATLTQFCSPYSFTQVLGTNRSVSPTSIASQVTKGENLNDWTTTACQGLSTFSPPPGRLPGRDGWFFRISSLKSASYDFFWYQFSRPGFLEAEPKTGIHVPFIYQAGALQKKSWMRETG